MVENACGQSTKTPVPGKFEARMRKNIPGGMNIGPIATLKTKAASRRKMLIK
jgi:hypothetical protein